MTTDLKFITKAKRIWYANLKKTIKNSMKIQFVIGAQDDCVCNRRVDVGSVEDVDFRKINVVEGLLRADEKE